MLLAHEVVTAPGATPTRAIAFLHGILGTGANLRAHARRFVQARPDWLALLVDLRAHGGSQGRDGADTLEHAAHDVVQTTVAVPVPLEAVVGHSFGGKVALQLALAAPTLGHVVTLDSAPGARVDAHGSESTLAVLTLLDGLRGQGWPSREAFVRALEAAGQSKGLSQWLAMNVTRTDSGYAFGLDLARIHALLDDYFAVDLWSVVEHSAAQVHLVIGERSTVYSNEERARAAQLELERHGQVTVDVLNAGHWVHVDDPEGVARVLLARL
jgi:pimeloyl-ACP methyl ester carboxylesterase